MPVAHDILDTLRRPPLLISAARFGLADYDRGRHLRRLLRAASIPTPSAAIERLIDEEAGLEAARRAGDAAYSAARHIDVLIALMGEARLLPRQPAGSVR